MIQVKDVTPSIIKLLKPTTSVGSNVDLCILHCYPYIKGFMAGL